MHGSSHSVASTVRLVAFALLLGCQSVSNVEDPRQWSEPSPIETRIESTGPPELAMDGEGNVVATWAQTETGFQNASDDIWINRKPAGGSWGTPETVESNEQGESFRPQLGIDGDGSVLIVFLQEEEEGFSVWSARNTSSGQWEAECIQPSSSGGDCGNLPDRGDAGRASLAVNQRGDAVAVWHEVAADGSVSLWSNRYVEGSWGAAEEIEPGDSNDLLNPHVAIAPDGTAIAIWERLDAATGLSSIFSERQTASGGWESFQAVETRDTGNAFNPRVIVDSFGNATAVWEQEVSEGTFEIWANRYQASTGSWGVAEPIEAADGTSSERPRIAVDAEGNVVAVWSRTGNELTGAWSNRYVVTSGWQTETPIGPTGLGSGRDPDIAVNAQGDAVAIWAQFDGVQDRMWFNTYSAGGAWGASGPVSTDGDALRLRNPKAALDVEGSAVAVWGELGMNVFDIVSSHFGEGPSPLSD